MKGHESRCPARAGESQLDICTLKRYNNDIGSTEHWPWRDLKSRPSCDGANSGRILAGKARRACQAGRRGQKNRPRNGYRNAEAETIASNTVPTKTITEAKKNKKNERNSEGVRASPPMVAKKQARQLKRAERPVRWRDERGGRDQRAAFYSMDYHSGAPKARRAAGNGAPLASWEIKGNSWIHFLVVIMASGIARGHVHTTTTTTTTTTTESCNIAAITETRLNLFSRPHS